MHQSSLVRITWSWRIFNARSPAKFSFGKLDNIWAQAFTWSGSLWISSCRLLVVARSRAANLELGYKLHDFPLKFFSRQNYPRRHRKSYFRREYAVDATVIRDFLGETRSARRRSFSSREDDWHRKSFCIDEYIESVSRNCVTPCMKHVRCRRSCFPFDIKLC